MQFLPSAISSVLAQTYQNFEIVIVNDGSSDNIEAWVSTLKDDRIRLISQVNKGLAEARNTGLQNAIGDYIAFLDADDVWHSQKLEKQVLVLDTHAEVGLVYSWILLIDKYNRPLKKVWTISAEGNVWKKITEGNIIACGSVPMIRRTCIETVGLFSDFPLCEDWDFWLRIAAHYPFKVIREILVFYRETPNSASRIQANGTEGKLQEMDKNFHLLIKRAFANVSSDLKQLEARSHALIDLQIAWIALKSHGNSYKHFEYYKAQALLCDPQIASLSTYKKIVWAERFIRLLGPQSYNGLKALPLKPLSNYRLIIDADIELRRIVGREPKNVVGY